MNQKNKYYEYVESENDIETEQKELNTLNHKNIVNQYITEYYKQLSDTWSVAQKKVNLKAPDVPQDVEQIEAFKRIWIDIFDNDFTELFDSGKFGENYGKLVSKELELTKHWNNITNVILQSVNLPSKEEIDEIYKETHSLKKRVGKLELELKKRKMKKNAK